MNYSPPPQKRPKDNASSVFTRVYFTLSGSKQKRVVSNWAVKGTQWPPREGSTTPLTHSFIRPPNSWDIFLLPQPSSITSHQFNVVPVIGARWKLAYSFLLSFFSILFFSFLYHLNFPLVDFVASTRLLSVFLLLHLLLLFPIIIIIITISLFYSPPLSTVFSLPFPSFSLHGSICDLFPSPHSRLAV